MLRSVARVLIIVLGAAILGAVKANAQVSTNAEYLNCNDGCMTVIIAGTGESTEECDEGGNPGSDKHCDTRTKGECRLNWCSYVSASSPDGYIFAQAKSCELNDTTPEAEASSGAMVSDGHTTFADPIIANVPGHTAVAGTVS